MVVRKFFSPNSQLPQYWSECCVFFPYFSLCIGQRGVAAPFTGWNYIAFNIYRGRRTLMQIAAAVSGVIQGSLKILTPQLSLQR